MRRTFLTFLVSAALAVGTVLPATAAPAPKKSDQSIADIAIGNSFDELVGALAYVDGELGTDLITTFATGNDQYTVFAPTDAAFGRLYGLLGVGGVTELDAETVLTVLAYHVTDGRRAANSVVPPRGERTITPWSGETFGVRTDGTIRDGLSAAGARPDAEIGPANLSARNGIVHVIDQVLVPPSVVAALG